VLVGPNKKEFIAHKDILCKQSPFFKAALDSKWIEGETKRVSLPEDDPSIFSGFLQWAYTRKIIHSASQTDKGTAEEIYHEFAKLYVLADKLGVVALKNRVIDEISQLEQATGLGFPSIRYQYVYENTAQGSLLRQYLVDLLAERAGVDFMKVDNVQHYPVECISEVLTRLWKLRDECQRAESIKACRECMPSICESRSKKRRWYEIEEATTPSGSG